MSTVSEARGERPRLRRGCGRHGGFGHFFGLDVERMSPESQTFAALAVLPPVTLSGIFLVTFVPGLWWLFNAFWEDDGRFVPETRQVEIQ